MKPTIMKSEFMRNMENRFNLKSTELQGGNTMTKQKSNGQEKIANDVENWENGTLGCDEAFVEIAEEITASDVNEMLELQMISIRLQKGMIRDLKDIAKHNGLGGYQPLIRRVLERFINAEMKLIARNAISNEESDITSSDAEKEFTYQQEKIPACG